MHELQSGSTHAYFAQDGGGAPLTLPHALDQPRFQKLQTKCLQRNYKVLILNELPSPFTAATGVRIP
jgi:hypothetical protein